MYGIRTTTAETKIQENKEKINNISEKMDNMKTYAKKMETIEKAHNELKEKLTNYDQMGTEVKQQEEEIKNIYDILHGNDENADTLGKRGIIETLNDMSMALETTQEMISNNQSEFIDLINKYIEIAPQDNNNKLAEMEKRIIDLENKPKFVVSNESIKSGSFKPKLDLNKPPK